MKIKSFVSLLTAASFLFAAFFLQNETIVQSQKNKIQINNPPVISLKPSTILEDLENHKKNNPQISGKELADYGNSLLSQKGFDYDISICDLIERKVKAKETKEILNEKDSETYVSFPYQFSLTDSTKRTFEIIAPNFDMCCCGYCYTKFPVLNITATQMTLIADGNKYTVKRTKDFAESEEHALVDNKTMLKEIRKWQVPYETIPTGISEDGTKLYVEGNFEGLVLEISGDGSFRFADEKDVKSGVGVLVENSPIDKNNDYLRFMRFKVGNKTYTVKYSGPCT